MFSLNCKGQQFYHFFAILLRRCLIVHMLWFLHNPHGMQTHLPCCVYAGSSMEVQCFEIKTEVDSNDNTEYTYDDKPSTGMFFVPVDFLLLMRRWYVLLCSVVNRRRRRRFRIDTEVRCVGAHPLFGPLSRRGLNPIKPVYDPDRRMADSIWQPAPLTNWVNILAVLVAGATATQNSPFSSLKVAVTIASTHCAYPRRDGQAELAWMASYVVR